MANRLPSTPGTTSPGKTSPGTAPTGIEALGTSDLSNHFLLAMPGMDDSNFGGAIILVAEHNERGALGLVVNKPTPMTLTSLLERIDLDDESSSRPTQDGARREPSPVLYGGPVQTDRGFVLHAPEGKFSSTVSISSEIALTTSKDVLEAVAGGNGPSRLLVTLGYAGWGPGQLEEEIARNIWMVIPADPELLFDTPIQERFAGAYRRLGIDPALMAPAAGHA